MPPLTDRIAVVAGATRGAGRGIAVALGEAGATVYCSRRSTRQHGATPGRPETIDETAEMVTARGGVGIPVRTDHTVASEVRALIDRIRADHGRLHVLVNDVWGGDDLTEWGKPLWEHSLDKGLAMLRNAIDSHIITSHHAIPLMLGRDGGLIVEVTDGVSAGFRGNVFYDLVKSSVIRLAMAMGYELRKCGITAVAITPGFLRSEAMLERFGVTEANWRDRVEHDPHFAESETPLFVGRAVAALASDPQVWRKNGGAYSSWDLSDEYAFVDADGRRPHWGRYVDAQLEALWPALIDRVRDRFAQHGLRPEDVVEVDRTGLMLRARVGDRAQSDDWVSRPVLLPELFMSDPATIAAELFDRYARASEQSVKGR
jgi:NAD(P)-dependent dehydrogenase (short-subunit alcohol dehydrogenase family)